MKNKFGFIMPRLIGATVVAGAAALIMATVFKLLLGITLLAAAGAMIARSFRKRREQLGLYGQEASEGFSNSSVWAGPIQPVSGNATSQGINCPAQLTKQPFI